jgi:hypothetical protein
MPWFPSAPIREMLYCLRLAGVGGAGASSVPARWKTPQPPRPLAGDPGRPPQRAKTARRGPWSPTPASQDRSPGTPVAPSRAAPISESRVGAHGDFPLSYSVQETKVRVWVRRPLTGFALLRSQPTTCRGMCMDSWRRCQSWLTCFPMVRWQSRRDGTGFDRQTRSGATYAGFWMRRQRTRLS